MVPIGTLPSETDAMIYPEILEWIQSQIVRAINHNGSIYGYIIPATADDRTGAKFYAVFSSK